MKKIAFTLALAALGIGAYATKTTNSSSKAVLLASGGSNCPVYYGCPVPPAPAPKGGGGTGGGGNSGGSGGGSGAPDNTAPHA